MLSFAGTLMCYSIKSCGAPKSLLTSDLKLRGTDLVDSNNSHKFEFLQCLVSRNWTESRQWPKLRGTGEDTLIAKKWTCKIENVRKLSKILQVKEKYYKIKIIRFTEMCTNPVALSKQNLPGESVQPAQAGKWAWAEKQAGQQSDSSFWALNVVLLKSMI